MTDITGFGLLGHALEMADASGVGLLLHFEEIPIIPAAVETTRSGFVPGGTRANLLHTQANVNFGHLGINEQLLLSDPQTSGGLLIAVSEKSARELIRLGEEEGVKMVLIGEVVEKNPGRIEVV